MNHSSFRGSGKYFILFTACRLAVSFIYLFANVQIQINNGGFEMVQFETMKAEEVKFGKNNFLEIARKKAITEEGDNEFISISRGFYLPDGSKKFKRNIAIPDDAQIREFVAKQIKSL